MTLSSFFQLVCIKFFGPTTSECGHEERRNDGLLTAKIGQLDGLVVHIGKGEAGSQVSDFEICLGRIEPRGLG